MAEMIRHARMLALLKPLFLETSSAHPMNIEEILLRMDQEGFPCERKTVYYNIRSMTQMGIVVRFRPHRRKNKKTQPSGWYYAGGWLDGTDPEDEKGGKT